MEFNGCNSYEQEAVMKELSQGIQLAAQLKAQMSSEIYAGETKGMLAERICSCLEKALLILKWGSGSIDQSHVHVVPLAAVPGSPLSVIGSPRGEEFNPACHFQQDSKKRKMMPTWSEQVKISSENAVEGAPEDAYSWRKYGQKDILGAKFPRSYYRCTYRNIQGCCATKQVQRNDEDPTIFNITYKGAHTCTLGPHSKSAPTSPQKKEHNNQNNFPITQYQQPIQQPDMLLNFQTGLRVDIQNLENNEPDFLFPTEGSGYETHTLITPPGYEIQPNNNWSTLGGVSFESDIPEIVSGTTSGTNSPTIGIDFPFNQWEFNPVSIFLSDNQAISSSFFQAKE